MSNKFDALKSVRTLDEGMNKKKWWKENLVGYAFILPWLVGFLAFIAYPLLSSVYYSWRSKLDWFEKLYRNFYW
ncbi:MAG: hypothetical protein ACOCXL_03220 [Halanaerobium sp.]